MTNNRLDQFIPGTRVRLIRSNDPYTSLRVGDEGEVMFIDAVGTIHIRWDSGSRLGISFDDGDQIEKVI